MKNILLCTLLLIFTATLPRATADEWISEEYRCALTIPTKESWKAEPPQSLPSGEVIFHASFMNSSQGIMITYMADLPSNDIRKPAVVKRVTDLLETQGWAIEISSQIERNKQPFIQFITRRRDAVAVKLIGVSRVTPRVTPRGRSLYIITAYGKGEADRAEDADFMRVMETFRFIDQSAAITDHAERPSAIFYKTAMLGAGGAAALLFCAFGVVVFLTRQREEDRA